MKLSNIFKKKAIKPRSNSSLTLEQLLEKAVTDPAFRIAFYKRLLTDELFFLTEAPSLENGDYTLKEKTSIGMVSYEDGTIPIFTSTDRIFDKGVINQQVNFMVMTGRNLFEATQGKTFMLNPYSNYGKELYPDEIKSLLNGSMFNDSTTVETMEKSTKVQIGQPEIYPTDMVNALKELFAECPNVNAAYLGWIFTPDSGELPHYIFALEILGDIKNVGKEAGVTAKQFLEEGEFVDFIQIDDGPLSHYFLTETEPFFKR